MEEFENAPADLGFSVDDKGNGQFTVKGKEAITLLNIVTARAYATADKNGRPRLPERLGSKKMLRMDKLPRKPDWIDVSDSERVYCFENLGQMADLAFLMTVGRLAIISEQPRDLPANKLPLAVRAQMGMATGVSRVLLKILQDTVEETNS